MTATDTKFTLIRPIAYQLWFACDDPAAVVEAVRATESVWVERVETEFGSVQLTVRATSEAEAERRARKVLAKAFRGWKPNQD